MSNTILSKTYSNLTSKEKRIETTVDMEGNKRLSITTHKGFSNELITRASVGIVKDGFVTYLMGRDYAVILQRGTVRLTAKNVQAQHDLHLASLDQHVAEAQKYYGVTIVKFDA